MKIRAHFMFVATYFTARGHDQTSYSAIRLHKKSLPNAAPKFHIYIYILIFKNYMPGFKNIRIQKRELY